MRRMAPLDFSELPKLAADRSDFAGTNLPVENEVLRCVSLRKLSRAAGPDTNGVSNSRLAYVLILLSVHRARLYATVPLPSGALNLLKRALN